MLFYFQYGKMASIMKHRHFLLVLTSILFVSGCRAPESTSSKSLSNTSVDTTSEISSEVTSSSQSTTSSTSTPQKVTVPAHTLKDSNPPIDVTKKGEQITEATWESFRNAPDSKFKGNYNYTYFSYAGGYQTIEGFTKNGYMLQSNYTKQYYERKSGNTFYSYIDTSEGYLRSETTLDIESKYIYRIQHEIYVHMFDFSNYEYDDYDGSYIYNTSSFGTYVIFRGGYLTDLSYTLGTNVYQIKLSFETTIDIPKSYYYK